MKIEKIIPVEDCLDGTFIYELVFDKPITRDFILFFKDKGEFLYLSHLPRPFFKVELEGKFYLKGIEGNTYCRTLLHQEKVNEILEEINSIIRSF